MMQVESNNSQNSGDLLQTLRQAISQPPTPESTHLVHRLRHELMQQQASLHTILKTIITAAASQRIQQDAYVDWLHWALNCLSNRSHNHEYPPTTASSAKNPSAASNGAQMGTYWLVDWMRRDRQDVIRCTVDLLQALLGMSAPQDYAGFRACVVSLQLLVVLKYAKCEPTIAMDTLLVLARRLAGFMNMDGEWDVPVEWLLAYLVGVSVQDSAIAAQRIELEQLVTSMLAKYPTKRSLVPLVLGCHFKQDDLICAFVRHLLGGLKQGDITVPLQSSAAFSVVSQHLASHITDDDSVFRYYHSPDFYPDFEFHSGAYFEWMLKAISSEQPSMQMLLVEAILSRINDCLLSGRLRIQTAMDRVEELVKHLMKHGLFRRDLLLTLELFRHVKPSHKLDIDCLILIWDSCILTHCLAPPSSTTTSMVHHSTPLENVSQTALEWSYGWEYIQYINLGRLSDQVECRTRFAKWIGLFFPQHTSLLLTDKSTRLDIHDDDQLGFEQKTTLKQKDYRHWKEQMYRLSCDQISRTLRCVVSSSAHHSYFHHMTTPEMLSQLIHVALTSNSAPNVWTLRILLDCISHIIVQSRVFSSQLTILTHTQIASKSSTSSGESLTLDKKLRRSDVANLALQASAVQALISAVFNSDTMFDGKELFYGALAEFLQKMLIRDIRLLQLVHYQGYGINGPISHVIQILCDRVPALGVLTQETAETSATDPRTSSVANTGAASKSDQQGIMANMLRHARGQRLVFGICLVTALTRRYPTPAWVEYCCGPVLAQIETVLSDLYDNPARLWRENGVSGNVCWDDVRDLVFALVQICAIDPQKAGSVVLSQLLKIKQFILLQTQSSDFSSEEAIPFINTGPRLDADKSKKSKSAGRIRDEIFDSVIEAGNYLVSNVLALNLNNMQ